MVQRRQILIGGGALALAGTGATYFGTRQMGSMGEYNGSVAATRAALSEHPEMQDFIRYATLAASGHNTQPWRFRAAAKATSASNRRTAAPWCSRSGTG
jgi:hypothetical protein